LKRLLPVFLLLLLGCSPVRVHEVSAGLPQGLKAPFSLNVSSDPKYLEGELAESVKAKFSKIASILPSNESGTINVAFKSKPALSTDSDGQQPFMTNPGSSPRKRHIFQSSEMEMCILDKNKKILWKATYRYEGRNDFKASYIQKPEEAMEECVSRVFEILEKDLNNPERETAK
jgi:hypothetical protein